MITSAEQKNSASKQERTTTKYLKQEIYREWNELWSQRFEDKQAAEDVARTDYELLFVEAGTIIRATKNYKPLELGDIIEKNEKILGLNLDTPRPNEGGWRKFAKDVLSNQPRCSKTEVKKRSLPEERTRNGPTKKGGRGYLHQF